MATEKQIEFYNEVRDQLEFYSMEAMHLFKDSPSTLCLIVHKDVKDKTDNFIYMLGFDLHSKLVLPNDAIAFRIKYPKGSND